MSVLLEVERLITSFPVNGKRVPVVDAISFAIAEGEAFALVGESGSGKSQTALSLLRLVPKPGRIDGGRVTLAGREISALPLPAMRSVRGREHCDDLSRAHDELEPGRAGWVSGG